MAATGLEVAPKAARKLGLVLGAGAGAVAAVVAIAVVAGGGGDDTASTATTATTAVSAGVVPTPATVTAGRGLTGIVSAVAGNGRDDGKGVPGPASEVSLGSQVNYAMAANGDVILTTGTVDVLRISAGQVTVFAKLDPGSLGLGGVAIGPDGSVFVATPGSVVKFAPGGGAGAVVVNARAAGLTTSLGPIAVDGAGSLYVADGSRRVTRVGADGSRSLVAGTGKQALTDTAVGDGGPAVASPLGVPTQLLIDRSGNLLIADTAARRVRRVASDGTITTIAGGGATPLWAAGSFAPDGTKATDLVLGEVAGVAVDGQGRIYVAEPGSGVIFRFGPDGGIELVIADQPGASETAGLPANATRAANPGQLAVDAPGNLLYLNARILWSIAGAGR